MKVAKEKSVYFVDDVVNSLEASALRSPVSQKTPQFVFIYFPGFFTVG